MSSLEIFNYIQILALVIITGGTLVIGALIAPLIFSELSREEANSLMINSFGKFDTWIKFSAIALLGGKIAELIWVRKLNFLLEVTKGEELVKTMDTGLIASTLFVLAIAAISLHIAYRLSPAIIQSYDEDSGEFRRLHKQSEILHRINFVLGLILLSHSA